MLVTNVRLALVQTNPTVGALESNIDSIFAQIKAAAEAKADVVVFGEMAITGYPIEDLASRETFLLDVELAIRTLAKRLEAAEFRDLAVVVGHPALASAQEQNGCGYSQELCERYPGRGNYRQVCKASSTKLFSL